MKKLLLFLFFLAAQITFAQAVLVDADTITKPAPWRNKISVIGNKMYFHDKISVKEVLSKNNTYSASIVGLGNVDNTSDLNKPISTDTRTALNLKYDTSNISNYPNVNITDSTIFTHNLNSQKLDVSFYEDGKKEINIIDWQPLTNSTIIIYLPIRDKPTKYKFTGDIYITKRY